MEILEYLKGHFEYDPNDQMIFLVQPNGNHQMFLDVRGWGAIQHLFPMTAEGNKEAGEFQDSIGEWVANTLNEKLNKNK
jgi:hypothetical protein